MGMAGDGQGAGRGGGGSRAQDPGVRWKAENRRIRRPVPPAPAAGHRGLGAEIADAGQMQRPARRRQRHILVFHNLDPDRAERRRDASGILPAIVIADHRINAQWRAQRLQMLSDDGNGEDDDRQGFARRYGHSRRSEGSDRGWPHWSGRRHGRSSRLVDERRCRHADRRSPRC